MEYGKQVLSSCCGDPRISFSIPQLLENVQSLALFIFFITRLRKASEYLEFARVTSQSKSQALVDQCARAPQDLLFKFQPRNLKAQLPRWEPLVITYTVHRGQLRVGNGPTPRDLIGMNEIF
jgi:hypothetical protein